MTSTHLSIASALFASTLLFACGSSSSAGGGDPGDAGALEDDGGVVSTQGTPDGGKDTGAAGSDGGGGGASYNPVPFNGGADAPVVASVEYRCTDGGSGNGFVEAQVVITDPQGPSNLTSFTDDHLGIFFTDPPSGPERQVGFTLEASGVHWKVTVNGYSDGWGSFYSKLADDSAVYAKICAADTWPMDILVVDNNGHVTKGLVRATRVTQ